MKSSLVELTQVYGAADVLQQAGQLRGLQVGERRLVLGDPLVQVGQFALDGLLHSPLPRLQLGVLRVSGGATGVPQGSGLGRARCSEPECWCIEADLCSRVRMRWSGRFSAPSRKAISSSSLACSFSPWQSSSCRVRYSSTASSTWGSMASISSRFLNQFTCTQMTPDTQRPDRLYPRRRPVLMSSIEGRGPIRATCTSELSSP